MKYAIVIISLLLLQACSTSYLQRRADYYQLQCQKYEALQEQVKFMQRTTANRDSARMYSIALERFLDLAYHYAWWRDHYQEQLQQRQANDYYNKWKKAKWHPLDLKKDNYDSVKRMQQNQY